MTPLFELKTLLTYEEYRKYNYFLQNKVQKLNAMRLIILIGFVLVSIVMFILGMRDTLNWYIAAFGVYVAYIFYYNWDKERHIKKTYESNLMAKNICTSIRFYEDCFEAEDKFGKTQVPYDKIYKIYESDTNFYIMISRMQGVGIIKDDCSESLCDFIRKIQG